jgi:hypothetical protein
VPLSAFDALHHPPQISGVTVGAFRRIERVIDLAAIGPGQHHLQQLHRASGETAF